MLAERMGMTIINVESLPAIFHEIDRNLRAKRSVPLSRDCVLCCGRFV